MKNIQKIGSEDRKSLSPERRWKHAFLAADRLLLSSTTATTMTRDPADLVPPGPPSPLPAPPADLQGTPGSPLALSRDLGAMPKRTHVVCVGSAILKYANSVLNTSISWFLSGVSGEELKEKFKAAMRSYAKMFCFNHLWTI